MTTRSHLSEAQLLAHSLFELLVSRLETKDTATKRVIIVVDYRRPCEAKANIIALQLALTALTTLRKLRSIAITITTRGDDFIRCVCVVWMFRVLVVCMCVCVRSGVLC